MIRAIVFDLGGVLIDLDFDNCVRSFREILGYERITEILDLSHQKGIYGDMEAGLISADEFRAEVLKDSRPGCVPADVDRAMAGLLTGMDPAKVPLLERLAEKYPVYGLSNNNEISTARMHEIYEESGLDWRQVFRKEFLSCRMKMMKPSREIFDAVAAEIGFPPAEAGGDPVRGRLAEERGRRPGRRLAGRPVRTGYGSRRLYRKLFVTLDHVAVQLLPDQQAFCGEGARRQGG